MHPLLFDIVSVFTAASHRSSPPLPERIQPTFSGHEAGEFSTECAKNQTRHFATATVRAVATPGARNQPRFLRCTAERSPITSAALSFCEAPSSGRPTDRQHLVVRCRARRPLLILLGNVGND
jgi:hypothetical protein